MSIFSQSQYTPKEERLEVASKQRNLYIGIPREHAFQENRIALTPSSVQTLIAHGHRVVIEQGAGKKAGFNDHEYSEAGAEIAYGKPEVFQCNILLKVAPPSLDELDMLRPNQILISPIHLPTLEIDYLAKLRNKRVIALAMEYIQDASGEYPIVHTLSEIAGSSAILTAAELLSTTNNGRGILLGGVAGVPPAKVVILGAGVVAEYAVRTALGLGAEVRIFDNNIHQLTLLQNRIGRRLYTSSINNNVLAEQLRTTDVAIGALFADSGATPCIVSEDMIAQMRKGSVIVDVSIDQGGCFATSHVTSHDKPTFIKYDVIHYCVPNIPSRVAYTASMAVSNILTPLLQRAGVVGSFERLLYEDAGLRHGVYTYKGSLTNQYMGERFGIKPTDINLLLTSNF